MKPVQEREMYSMKDYYKNMEDSWVEFVSKNIRAQAYPQNNMQPQESKGVSIASMVLGIFSLTFGCCITYVGIATAIAGLITGIISLKDKKPGKGMAIAGIIMSAIALVFLVFCIILVLTSDTYQDMVDEILRQIQSGSY